MLLADISTRALPPEPWREGDNIPWNEPAFSARMLREHLSQEHDAASRRGPTIDRHVAWLHRELLGGKPSAVLDLGCGPGLYASRLARLGHRCVGVDFSPASIAYAQREAGRDGLECRYVLADLREADFGGGFDLAMLIFGELNVFPRRQAAGILARAGRALANDGALVIEAHTFAAIQRSGAGAPSWYASAGGLFGETPYLCLTEHFWHAAEQAATTRHFVVDLAGGAVTRYAQSFQAYDTAGYADLLAEAGFTSIAAYPSLAGEPDSDQADFFVLVARK